MTTTNFKRNMHRGQSATQGNAAAPMEPKLKWHRVSKQLMYHFFYPFSLPFVLWLDGYWVARNQLFIPCSRSGCWFDFVLAYNNVFTSSSFWACNIMCVLVLLAPEWTLRAVAAKQHAVTRQIIQEVLISGIAVCFVRCLIVSLRHGYMRSSERRKLAKGPVSIDEYNKGVCWKLVCPNNGPAA